MNSIQDIRIIAVIPGPETGSSMIFSKRQVASLKNSGVNIIPFYLSSRTSIRTLIQERKRFRKLYKEYKPCIIHSHYGTVTSMFCALSSTAPMLITFQGSDINGWKDDGLLRNFFARLFSQFSALKARKIICVGESMKQKLWWGRSRSLVLPMGVDIKFFVPIERDVARKQLDWPFNEKTILFNASNPLIKRLDIAMEVEKVISRAKSGIRFIFLDGTLNPDQMKLYLNAADVLLVCSDTEGSPVLIKEAMACNLPIVSNDVGDIRYRINGLLNCYIEERNPELLAERILDILKNGKRSDGRDKVIRDEIDEEHITQKLKDLYNSIWIKV